MLAEALDYIWEAQDVRLAAEALGVSASQMTKLLVKEKSALALVNSMRLAKGQGPLRPR